MPEIKSYTISNTWMDITICTLGCTITAINVPGKDSGKRNIVLRYDDVHDYFNDQFYIGSTVGRVAGRIGKSKIVIDDNVFHLTPNDGDTGNHLHGGAVGFNKRIFELVSQDEQSITLYYQSSDAEEGYPGEVKLWITISLSGDNKVSIRYRASTDKKTHINLTNHSYFNFSGRVQPATDNELYLNADQYVETDKQYIPTGRLLPVANTVYDFRQQRRIDQFESEMTTGYNECFVLNNDPVQAILFDPESGIQMKVSTTSPGLLLYTGDFLDQPFIKNQGICLETQYFPDSANHPKFPSTLLSPNEEYLHETVWAFDHA